MQLEWFPMHQNSVCHRIVFPEPKFHGSINLVFTQLTLDLTWFFAIFLCGILNISKFMENYWLFERSSSEMLRSTKILVDIQSLYEIQLIITIDDFSQTCGQADVILLDFSKAFDKVPHNLLCEKLAFYGIRGPLPTWVRNFHTNRTQCVILNGQLSNVLSVVPQGTVLGSLLFLCYINDLPNNVISRVKLYADDVLLYSPVSTITDCHNLQKHLERLVQWADRWQMNFNLPKCEMIRITNRINLVFYIYIN